MRRRTRWALAAAGVVALAAVALALHGGWRPFGAAERPLLASIPGDVDVACRLDVRALRSAPLLADPVVAGAIARAAGLESPGAFADPALGDEAAFAMRDGSWLAVIRVSGPVHGARLGLARIFFKMTGDGPVFEATTPDDDTVHVARHGSTWIVSDDEELAKDALACAENTGAPLTSRLDLGDAFTASHTAAAWVCEDAATYVLDALRAGLGDAASAVVRALPPADSACAVTVDAAPDAPRAGVAVSWQRGTGDPIDLEFRADLAELARVVEDDAAKAPPPAPRNEPSDRVRLTIELSRAGLAGEELRLEVARRMTEKAAARVTTDAAAALAAAHRRAALLRTLGNLAGRLTAKDRAARLELTLSR